MGPDDDRTIRVCRADFLSCKAHTAGIIIPNRSRQSQRIRAVVAITKENYISPLTYLQKEETQEERHDYHDGRILAMSGGTWEHCIIGTNFGASLSTQLRTSTCEVHIGGIKVHVRACKHYFYADIAVFCGSPSFTDGRRDTVDNPVLVVEVLLESTQQFDRTTKLDC